MKIKKAREICQRFANDHKTIFLDKGEVGFGRECVGFLRDGAYIDYNPTIMTAPFKAIEGFEGHLYISSEIAKDAYHKTDCMAVLVHDDNYDEAIIQLALWVEAWEKEGELEVVQYENGYGPTDMIGVMMHGLFGWGIRYKKAES